MFTNIELEALTRALNEMIVRDENTIICPITSVAKVNQLKNKVEFNEKLLDKICRM